MYNSNYVRAQIEILWSIGEENLKHEKLGTPHYKEPNTHLPMMGKISLFPTLKASLLP